MATIKQESKQERQKRQQTIMELFVETTENSEWKTIDDLASVVKQNPKLASMILKGDLTDKMLKIGIRGLMQRIRQESGVPLYASIKTTDDAGNVTQVYKQETLFDVSDYQQAAAYHGKAVVHHAQLAAHYAKGYKELTGKQMHLPFDARSILLD